MPVKKTIPHSSEAEIYVLGSMLIEPNLVIEYGGRLTEDYFYNTTHKIVFNAIKYLYLQKKEANIINLIETLKMQGKYDDVTENFLIELSEAVPSVVTAEAYVNVLEDKALERELYYETQRIGDRVLKGEEELSVLLKAATDNFTDIANKQRTGDLKLVGTVVGEVFDVIQKNQLQRGENSVIGLDTGYSKLNEFTFGFQPGELIILAARPGVGKTSLALNMAYKMCRNGKKVAFFSLEMGVDQLIMRLFSMAGNIPLSSIRSGDMNADMSNALLSARVEIDGMNFYIDETTSNSMEDIKIKCRKLGKDNLDIIVVDYLQLLSASSGKQRMSRYEEVSSISRSLKLLAREMKVPVLALSQLSRAVETRTREVKKDGSSKNAKPQLSDLRESGSIEQDADIVMFLHSDNISEDATQKHTNLKMECIVAKNRQGMTGSFSLVFRSDCCSFAQATTDKKSKTETA